MRNATPRHQPQARIADDTTRQARSAAASTPTFPSIRLWVGQQPRRRKVLLGGIFALALSGTLPSIIQTAPQSTPAPASLTTAAATLPKPAPLPEPAAAIPKALAAPVPATQATPAPPTPPPQPRPFDYRIEPGDYLGKIGQRFGCSVEELMLANDLRNDRIYAGKKLIIPECGNPAATTQPKPKTPGTTSTYSAAIPKSDSKVLPRLLAQKGFQPPRRFMAMVVSISLDEENKRIRAEKAYDWRGTSATHEGWNPASTIKIFAAIAALRTLQAHDFGPEATLQVPGRPTAERVRIDQLVRRALVDSDNLAHNRLVQLAGFDALNKGLLSERFGIRHSAILRAYQLSDWQRLGESASFAATPTLKLRQGSRELTLPATQANVRSRCRASACTTLRDLSEAMRRSVLQPYLAPQAGFELNPTNHRLLLDALSRKGPRGNEARDALVAAIGNDRLRVYSKPGFSEDWFSDVILVHDPLRHHAYIVAMAAYPGRQSLTEAARLIGQSIAQGAFDE